MKQKAIFLFTKSGVAAVGGWCGMQETGLIIGIITVDVYILFQNCVL